jgi:signal transduction histidine kinase
MNDKRKEREKKPLILVVEDFPKNMEVVCNILRKEGYRLAMAGNGKQALDMMNNIRPDLILLDIMMPEMDGFEACKRLKKDPVTRDIPVIFLTAKADTADVVKGFELGAVDYVTKPFKAAELMSRVKTHLELKLAREALLELNATKDTFFSIIGHDLKDPLQFLLLAAELLHNDYDDMDEDKRKKYIERFYTSSQQISGLVENLLEWSRSQIGTLQINLVSLDLHALAAEAHNLLQERALEKDIIITSHIPPGTTALGDENMVRTIFRNLISNALKFTHAGGSVKVKAAPNARGDYMEVSVTDTGVGMSEEDAAGLFHLNIKRTTRGTAKEKGSGLGLILCKEFLQKINGHIRVTSEEGKGSCFTFSLPLEA